tara:strand:- start:17143 stop:17658 length:516 start_codon:yes stop_codon:yes gene_type:complete
VEWSDIKDISISVAALTGMILGVWNLFSDRRKQKVRLKVTPKAATHFTQMADGSDVLKYSTQEFSLKGAPDMLAIEILNMSEFPVTISEIGLHAPKRKNRFAVPLPELVDDGEWPRRLESRENVLAFIDWSTLLDAEGTNLIKCAYAKTDCGTFVKGNNKAMKSFIKQVCV